MSFFGGLIIPFEKSFLGTVNRESMGRFHVMLTEEQLFIRMIHGMRSISYTVEVVRCQLEQTSFSEHIYFL